MRHFLKQTLLSILIASFSFNAFAQFRSGNQEVSIGAGILTSEQLFDGTTGGLLLPVMRQYKDNSPFGICFVDYKYFVNRRFTVGVFAGIESEKGDWFYDYIQGNKPDNWSASKIGTFSRIAYTIAPEVSITYRNEKNVRIYSTLGMGVTIKMETDHYTLIYSYYNQGYTYGPGYSGSPTKSNDIAKFNAYYSPFGLSFGRKLRGIIELGIGYKGIFNGGLAYKIDTRKHRTVKNSDKVPQSEKK